MRKGPRANAPAQARRSSPRRGKPLVVAIDGPSGVGKSTVSRLLARRLGIAYLDSGALYRACALEVLRAGVDPDDAAAVERLLRDTRLDVEVGAEAGTVVRLGGAPVGNELRDPAVARTASTIAAQPAVRRLLTSIQRSVVPPGGAVVEGRDIGSVVFPETPHKFFLDARLEVRGRRRLEDVRGKRSSTTLEETVADIRERDRRDRERSLSPLRRDDTYQVVDTSDLSADDVARRIEHAIRPAGRSPRRAGSAGARRSPNDEEGGMARSATRDLERTYSRQQFVAKLRRLADAIERGRPFTIQVAGERLRIPAGAEFNVEHERAGVQDEIEFQLRWPAGGAGSHGPKVG